MTHKASIIKKISLSILMVFSPSVMFAYYKNDFSSGYTPILIAVLSVWGILEIVLFFKIWGMTNNIKEIKDYQINNQRNCFRRCRLTGQNDKAAEYLISEFFKKMEWRVGNGDFNHIEKIQEEVSELEYRLSQCGVNIPEGIKSLKTLGDFWDAGFIEGKKTEDTEVATQPESQKQD